MKDQYGNVLRLCREYEDLSGIQRTAIYLEYGPAGNRWLMEDGSIVTIDAVELADTSIFDPWSSARNVRDSWVIEGVERET